MIDQATNGDGDTGRFEMLNVWERDDPEQAPEFKRDQGMTPVEQFRARAIAILEDEADVDSDLLRTRESVISTCIDLIREIQP